MEGSQLDGLVRRYLQASLAPSTRRTYTAAYRRYSRFCTSHRYPVFPLVEATLCHYVAYLAFSGLKCQTIKSYLSAIRYYQIMGGLGDPFNAQMCRLEYVLKGIKAEQARSPTSTCRTRLPITPDILTRLRLVWERDRSNHNNIMLWAAVCICFFGFLRSGEICVPSQDAYDPGAHLSFGDVTLDNRHNPTLVQLTIKASKTDPFRKGVTIYLGKTEGNLCPVSAVAAYLAVRGGSPGPFFRFESGRSLTREAFVVKVREALSSAGLNPRLYAGHSFRSGAATTAAACGIADSLIKTLGRWESSAYQLYIHTPRERLAAVSSILANSHRRPDSQPDC